MYMYTILCVYVMYTHLFIYDCWRTVGHLFCNMTIRLRPVSLSQLDSPLFTTCDLKKCAVHV